MPDFMKLLATAGAISLALAVGAAWLFQTHLDHQYADRLVVPPVAGSDAFADKMRKDSIYMRYRERVHKEGKRNARDLDEEMRYHHDFDEKYEHSKYLLKRD